MKIENSTMAILDKNGNKVGTGFLISSQYALTCAHVIRDAGLAAENRVSVYFTLRRKTAKATVMAYFGNDRSKPDIAILEFENQVSSIPPVHLGPAEGFVRNSRFASFGYAVLASEEGIHVDGDILGLLGDGGHLQLRASPSEHGISGAPVFDEKRQRVIGMIDKWGESNGHNRDTAFAIPGEILLSICSRLEIENLFTEDNLYSVPDLPEHYIFRENDIARVRELILGSPGNFAGKRLVGLHGMSGQGKSVLAAAIAYDPDVQRQFQDGVFWIKVSSTPDLAARQIELSDLIEPYTEKHLFKDEGHGRSVLRRMFKGKMSLLILDDVWSQSDAEYLNVIDRGGCILLTSQDSDVLLALGADTYSLEPWGAQDSRRLLSLWAGQSLGDLPPQAASVIEECGKLPLALAMAGAAVQGRPEHWDTVLYHLENANLERLRTLFPGYDHLNLLKAIEAGIAALTNKSRQSNESLKLHDLYFSTAIFADDVLIPEPVLEMFWAKFPFELNSIEVREVLERLLARSLMWKSGQGYYLHDLQRAYLRKQDTDLETLHSRLLDCYAALSPKGWWSGPDDGYFFKKLTYHLCNAGRIRDAENLLFSFTWLESKLQHTDVTSIISDYDKIIADNSTVIPLKTFGEIRAALRAARSILHGDKGQLAAQLLARLHQEGCTGLLNEAKNSFVHPWFRPLIPSLARPGFLRWQLYGHSKSVTRVVSIGTSQNVLSASDDGTLKAWNSITGQEVFHIQAHEKAFITSLAVTPDGMLAVSTSNKGEITVWDLETHLARYHFALRGSYAVATTCTPDSQKAVVVDTSGTYQLISLKDGTKQILGHEPFARVRDLVCPSPDLLKAVYANGQLITWSIAPVFLRVSVETPASDIHSLSIDHQTKCLMAGHANGDITIHENDQAPMRSFSIGQNIPVRTVVWIDSRKGLSISTNNVLQVWDLDTGQELLMFEDKPGSLYSGCGSGELVVTASSDGSLKVLDLTAKQNPEDHPPHASPVITVNATESTCVTTDQDGQLLAWDLEKLAIKAVNRIADGYVTCSLFLPGNSHIALGTNDGRVLIWNMESGNETECIYKSHPSASFPVSIYAMGFLADKNSLVLALSNGALAIYELNTQEYRLLPRAHNKVISSLAVFDENRRVITASHDGFIKIWDTESWKPLISLPSKRIQWRSVSVFSDGKTAVSASINGQIALWDLTIGQKTRSWKAVRPEGKTINAVRVAPGAETILTISDDCTVRAWDLVGNEICKFSGDYPLQTCDLIESRQLLVVGDKAGRVHFLSLDRLSETTSFL